MPIGLAVAGPLADAVGIHALLVVETAIAIPVALAVVSSPSVRGLRRATDAAGGGAGEPAAG
jgi:hypothetical protein